MNEYSLAKVQKKLLIPVDTLFALALALTLTLSFTLTVPFTLCTDVIAEHGTEDEVLFGRELVQRTGDDEPDGLQALAPPEVYILIVSSCRL